MPGVPGRSGRGQAPTRRTGAPPPRPPAGISKEARKKWHQVVKQIPEGILIQVDVHQLRILCDLLVRFDVLSSAVANDPANQVLGRAMLAVAQHIDRLSSSFGLTPAHRQRLRIEEKDETKDEIDEWLESTD